LGERQFRDLLDPDRQAKSLRAVALDKYLAVMSWLVPPALQPECVDILLRELADEARAVEACVFDSVRTGDVLRFRRPWRFHDLDSLAIMFDEIFLKEEYFIPAGEDESDLAIVDLGANIGLTALYFKCKYPLSRVISFEPNPEIYKILEANFANSRYPHIEARCAAVGGEAGSAGFWLSAQAPMAGRLESAEPPPAAFQRVETAVVSIRDILEPLPRVDLLKVDIEGSEVEVIAAAGPLLRKCRFIFVECHPSARVPSGNTLQPVLQELDRQGFKCHVARSAWSERGHGFRPLRHAHQNYSACVYATRP
jgi:FkbM family methyltransferase